MNKRKIIIFTSTVIFSMLILGLVLIKQYIIAVAILLASIFVPMIIESVILKNLYKNRMEFFNEENASIKDADIVFVGDSITQFYEVDKFFEGKIYNRGICGDTIKNLPKRINESIFNLTPKKIFLQMGTNDIVAHKSTCDDIIHDMRIVLKAIQEKLPNSKIHLISLYPVVATKQIPNSKQCVATRNNDKIDKINQNLNRLAKELNITYININPLLKSGETLNPNYTQDGLHLNNIGYKIVTNELKQYM